MVKLNKPYLSLSLTVTVCKTKTISSLRNDGVSCTLPLSEFYIFITIKIIFSYRDIQFIKKLFLIRLS